MPGFKKVAIVGGGIAGVYTAWRLTRPEVDVSYDITLLEATDRFGGRIRSQLIPPLKFRAELGAMRFHPTHHLLRALIDDLDIPTRPFDIPAAHLRVRGRTLTPTELLNGGCSRCGASVPYLLRTTERELSADDLVQRALQMLFRDLSFPNAPVEEARFHKEALLAGNYTDALWKFVRLRGVYENVPLRDIGFWNLLQHYLSNEAVSLVHTALSLESVIGNWNAAEAIPWFMADYSNPKLSMIPGGMSRVIEKMLGDVKQVKNDWLRPGTAVTSCKRDGGKWLLSFKDQPSEGFDNVIFAIPLEALKRIEITDANNDALELPWLSSVETHRLFKVFLLFENPWWVSSGIPAGNTGRTYTDLPLRQVYYFHPDWMEGCHESAKREGNEYDCWANFSDEDVWADFRVRWPNVPKAPWSLVMASYSDEHHVSFWRPATAAARSETSALHYNDPEGLTSKEARLLRSAIELIPDSLRIRSRTVQKILQQLREIHGQAVPEPIAGIYMDWDEEPFRAGWHTWIIGSDPDANNIADYRDNGLHFCGEAWSRDQGWIEGALKTAECVLAGPAFKVSPTKTSQVYVDGNFERYIGRRHA